MTVKDPILRCIFLLHDVSKLLPIFHTVLDALVVIAIYIAAGLELYKKKRKTLVLKGYNLKSALHARAYKVKQPKWLPPTDEISINPV